MGEVEFIRCFPIIQELIHQDSTFGIVNKHYFISFIVKISTSPPSGGDKIQQLIIK